MKEQFPDDPWLYAFVINTRLHVWHTEIKYTAAPIGIGSRYYYYALYGSALWTQSFVVRDIANLLTFKSPKAQKAIPMGFGHDTKIKVNCGELHSYIAGVDN